MFSGTTIDERGAGRSLAVRAVHALWIPAVVVRIVAVLVLVGGPWTDQPAELAGWDAERFQEIAERTEPGWSSFPIEYPPGSVVVFDTIGGPSVVETSRNLVLLAAAAELAAVVLLWRRFGAITAKAFLVLGLVLVPMGLVRLDLIVVALAVAASALLLAADGAERPKRPRWSTDIVFGAFVAAGAMVKLWPALLILGALAVGRRSAAIWAIVATGVSGVVWLVLVGDGLGPVDQVLSLRGATGWHVESLPGALVALATSDPARLELNAFRIGTLNQPLVTAGRGLALVVMAALVVTAAGVSRRPRAGPSTGTSTTDATIEIGDIERFGFVMLGSVAALLVTAPLLSPQFLLWLTPWGALLIGAGGRQLRQVIAVLIATLATVLVLTGATLLAFGPPNLSATAPALLLTIRNFGLVALPVLCLLQLRRHSTKPTPSPRP